MRNFGILTLVTHTVALTVFSSNDPPGQKPSIIGVKGKEAGRQNAVQIFPVYSSSALFRAKGHFFYGQPVGGTLHPNGERVSLHSHGGLTWRLPFHGRFIHGWSTVPGEN